MAHRVVTGVARDQRQRIETLYGDDEAWSPVAAWEAAAQMRAGVHTYSVESAGGSARIRPYSGRWVRTVKDTTQMDNLDVLGGPAYGRLGAGAFDVVMTLGPDAVDRFMRTAHASGAVVDRIVLGDAGTLVEATLGPPLVEPDPSGDPSCFVVLREALCWVHSASDGADPGFTAVAVTRARCDVAVTVDASTALARFRMRYRPADVQPVSVQTAVSGERRTLLTTVLGRWLGDLATDVWTLPLDGALAGVSEVRPALAPSGHVQIGLTYGGRRPDAFPEPERGWDWTIAFSRPFLAARVGETLRRSLGGLPAPMGDDRRVLISAADSVYLRYLELELPDGAIVVRGIAYRDATPVVTAEFSAQFLVGIDGDGLVEVTLEDTDVEVVEWYARVADFLTGGALAAAVEDSLREAIQAAGIDRSASFLTPELLQRAAAAGTANTVLAEPTIGRAWVARGALNLAGSLDLPAPAPPDVQVIPMVHDGAVTLHGQLSTVAGAAVSRLRWDIDGTVVSDAMFDRRALVLSRPLAAGTHVVTLTIESDDGLLGTSSVTFDVP